MIRVWHIPGHLGKAGSNAGDFLTRKGMINVDFWSADSTWIACVVTSFFLPT
jgi:hypothetical protein